MIKSIKVLAVIASTIALLPSVSFADTLSGNTQSVNQESIIFGSNNTVRSDVRQSIINTPAARPSTISTNAQRAETTAIVIGDDNTTTQSIVQENIGRQRSK